jgi:hypothetical protein
MLNLVNCLNQMGNEFGGLSYHHFLALVLLHAMGLHNNNVGFC